MASVPSRLRASRRDGRPKREGSDLESPEIAEMRVPFRVLREPSQLPVCNKVAVAEERATPHTSSTHKDGNLKHYVCDCVKSKRHKASE